jgi:ribosomal protein L36
MAVREHIINPILKALEWDTENPKEVLPNVVGQEGIPDYTLFKEEKKVLIIEVKKLNVDIEEEEIIAQLGRYCYSKGVEYGLLTNGTMWILFKSFQKDTSISERIIWKVNLENEELSEASRKLVTISKTNIENIEFLVKKNEILNDVWQSLVKEQPKEMIKSLLSFVKSIITQDYPGYHFEDSEIENFLEGKIAKIAEMFSRLPGKEPSPGDESSSKGPRRMKIKNEIFEFDYYYEILINTANWLIKNGKLKPSNCPVKIGRSKKRYIINKEPKHKDGKDFFAPKELSNGLWIETNYSAASCENIAKQLLEKFGFSPEILLIE